MSFKACVLAAGSSRGIGDFSDHVHKAVLPVAGQAVISHIIEKLPADTEIVIAIGHRKETVVDYLNTVYPERRFTFVEVEHDIGPGTGPGLSLLQCRPHLDGPFILTTADTIVGEDVPAPDRNWFGVSEVSDTAAYCSVKVDGTRVYDLKDKVPSDNTHAFIGLAGIKDHAEFFDGLEHNLRSIAGELQVSAGFQAIGDRLEAQSFTWFDTGTLEGFRRANEELSNDDESFDFSKPDEFLYFANGRVVKFFADEYVARARVARAKVLEGLCPEIVSNTRHFYAYKKVPGRVLYDVLSPEVVRAFLAWGKAYLWHEKVLREDERAQFDAACSRFYKDKTLDRLKKFYEKTKTPDVPNRVNGVEVPRLEDLLAKLDWSYVCDGSPALFHGDLQFDNILYSEDAADDRSRFVLLDWRHDFGGLIEYGDLYYDLAKLYGGMVISYKGIKQNKFEYRTDGDDVHIDFQPPPALLEAKDLYEASLVENGFDLHKVRLMTSLIFLNMSPLHHAPFDIMLYHLSRSMLSAVLSERDAG